MTEMMSDAVETSDEVTIAALESVETMILEGQDSLMEVMASARSGSVVKRLFDLVVATALLVLTFPILVLIAAFIKLDSNGPVFFRQNRHGQKGEIVRVFKFRSMYSNMTDHACLLQTELRDFRVTRLGRFLRAHSIDEVPQLLNVLKGDMSLVAPRPHAVGMLVEGVELDTLHRWKLRHSVKPGLTGLAQVSGSRGALTTIDAAYTRLDYDLQYIQEWSIWLDFLILLRTVKVCLKDKGAW